ncbi:hypothetical protein BJX99DRAFT_253265 [Aspergillus californicus]
MSQEQEPVPCARVAAMIAKILDEAEIPNILWGWAAVGLSGATRTFPEVDFIIADHYIAQAIMELGKTFPTCKDGKCLEWKGDRVGASQNMARITAHNQWHHPAVTHYHLGAVILSLQKKTELLFLVARLRPRPPPHPNDPHLTLSNSTSLPRHHSLGPSGPWHGLYPIQILNPNSFLEALIFLQALTTTDPAFLGRYPGKEWELMMVAIAEVELRPQLPQEYRRVLRPEFRLVWDYLKFKKPKGHNPLIPLVKVRKDFMLRKILPPWLPDWDFSHLKGWDEVKSFMRDDTLLVPSCA